MPAPRAAQSIGATVFFGSIFARGRPDSLFVVPAMYVKIACNTRSPQYLSQMIDRLVGAHGERQPVEAPQTRNPPVA